MVTIESRARERFRVVSQGEKFRGKTTAKTMRGWINGYISKSSKQGNTEMEFIMREVLNAYNHFHPKETIEVDVDSWKGKSSFEIHRTIEGYGIIKYQKPAKGEEPKKIVTEVTLNEMNALQRAIIKLSKEETEIKTRKIAQRWTYYIDYDWRGWKMFFSDRRMHNKLTLMLGALDKMGIIHYKGGKSSLVKQ